jgi:hypothetical protein
MRDKNETMEVLFLLLKFSARLLIGAWLLRKYVEEKVFGDEERTSDDGMMSLWLFLTSAVEALVRAIESWREEKLKKRRWCETFVSLAMVKKNDTDDDEYLTIKKMVDIARTKIIKKESVGEVLLSASFMVACAAILALSASKGEAWQGVYVTAILMLEIFERRFFIARFVTKHRRRRSWLQYVCDDNEQQTIPKIAVGAFANSPGDEIYIVGKYRDQLFDRIVDGTHQIIHNKKYSSGSSNINDYFDRYFPPTFTDHHIKEGMVYITEGKTCPRFLCFSKEEVLNNILAFTKEEEEEDVDDASNEINLRAKIANGLLTSLMMTPGGTAMTRSEILPSTPTERNNKRTKKEKDLDVYNVGVLFNTTPRKRNKTTLLHNIDSIGVGRALVSGRHFVFLRNPPASIVSDPKIAHFFASKTCVFTTNDLVLLKKNTRVVFANTQRGTGVSYIGTFASLLTEKNFGSELAKTFFSRERAEREERDDEMYAEPVAKIETACYRLLRCCRKGILPSMERILDSNNRATFLAFSAMILSLILIAAINAQSIFIDSTAFIVSVFAPIFLCVLVDLAYTKTWIWSIFTERKMFYKTVAFGKKIHDGIEEIIYSGFSFRFKAILDDAAKEYCAENTAILHEIVVKTVVILSFFVLMIASNVAFFETEDFTIEDDRIRTNRAASTFFALVVARDSMCSFLENLSKNSVSMHQVARMRSAYEARKNETRLPKNLRRTRSMI